MYFVIISKAFELLVLFYFTYFFFVLNEVWLVVIPHLVVGS